MAEDSGDRTEPATAKRLSKAREEGNVPRSRELSTFSITMTGVVMLTVLGGRMGQYLQEMMRSTLSFDHSTLQTPDPALLRFRDAVVGMLLQMMPLFGALVLVAIFTPLLIGGWNLSFGAVRPKFGKFNPLPGIARMFSASAAAEAVKAVFKSLLIGGVATWVIWNERADILGLATMPLQSGLPKMLDLAFHTFFIVTSAMFLLVAMDVPFQLWNYHKQLRMTKEEIKQEFKEQEGSPQVKSRIRQMQREAARRRMMQEIPTANVIVTNPTHYAVALRYTEGMRAPRLVAKGALKLAERIIDSARENRVAVMRAPSFARALYFNAELEEEIPTRLYAAAAQVLAYVYQLKLYEMNGGLAPAYPEKIEVPADLDPQSKRPQDAAPDARP
jgi:flagellar biosynthetic protein FlhB